MTPPNTYEEVPWMHKSISSFFLPFMTLSRTPREASIPKWTNATRKPCVSLCAYTACLPPRKASHKRHSSLWRPMRRFHGCTNRPLLSFFLSFLLLWHRLGRHGKLRFASEPTQRRSLVYALTPHCLLPRKASYKKILLTWRPMRRRFHRCTNRSLSSFFLSFFLLWHRLGRDKKLQFASGPTHRGSLVSLSMLLHRMSLLPRKASHKKTFLSPLVQISSISTNTKIDHRQNVMPNSLWKHHDSTMQTSSNKFLNLSLFPLQWIDLKRTSLCISFSFLGCVGGGGVGDHPDLYIFIASWNQFKAHPNSCCFQGPLQHDINK